MEPPTATMAICAAESWWRSPSSWNCRGADDSVGMQQHSIGKSCGTPRSRRDFSTLGGYPRFRVQSVNAQIAYKGPAVITRPGNCYEGIGIWLNMGAGETPGSAGSTVTLGTWAATMASVNINC